MHWSMRTAKAFYDPAAGKDGLNGHTGKYSGIQMKFILKQALSWQLFCVSALICVALPHLFVF